MTEKYLQLNEVASLLGVAKTEVITHATILKLPSNSYKHRTVFTMDEIASVFLSMKGGVSNPRKYKGKRRNIFK